MNYSQSDQYQQPSYNANYPKGGGAMPIPKLNFHQQTHYQPYPQQIQSEYSNDYQQDFYPERSSSYGSYSKDVMGSSLSSHNEDRGQEKMKEIFEKKRKSREAHNAVERRRRDNINDRINEIKCLLPEELLIEKARTNSNGVPSLKGRSQQVSREFNKGDILQCSVEYIKELQEKADMYQKRVQELGQILESIRGGSGAGLQENNTYSQYNDSNTLYPSNSSSARYSASTTPTEDGQMLSSMQFPNEYSNLPLNSSENNSL